MNEQYKHLLEEAIQQLPLKDRFIVRLHLAGESEVHIGQAFRVSQQAINKQLRRIKTELAAKCSNSDGAF